MEKNERKTAEAFAIEDGPTEIAGRHFRVFTSLGFDRCERLGIRIATAGQEEIESMDGLALIREAACVGWMQSAPREEVRRAFAAAVGDPDHTAVWDAVEEWEEAFNERSPEAWPALIRRVAEIVLTARALMINIVMTSEAAKLTKDAEDPPPNGSGQGG